MKILSLSLLISFSWTLWAEVTLTEGESRTFSASPNAAIAVSDAKIIKVKDQGSHVLVIAKTPGRATLNIGATKHNIKVLETFQSIFHKKLKAKLQGFMGLRLSLDRDNQIEIQGTLFRLSDWMDIQELAEQHSGTRYKFKAQVHKSIIQDTDEWLKQHLQQLGLPRSSLNLSNAPSVELTSEFNESLEHIRRELSPLGLQIKSLDLSLPTRPSILIEVVIAEVDKTFERELGLRWGNSGKYSAQVLPTPAWESLGAELTALEAEGQGQILAKPRLLTRSGEKSEFHAGGEIPIRTAGWRNQNVAWKKHGILLTFEAKADRHGSMNLGVNVEVSIPNLSQTVGQLPTFETNRVNSYFDLKGSQTVVLSGLVRNSSSNFREGVPFLSQIPVLGRLFGSPRFQSRKTELVIFVTPRILNLENEEHLPTLPKGLTHQ